VDVTVAGADVARSEAVSGRRRAGTWLLPEVRWAAAATVLFVCGLLVQVTDGPVWLSGTLLLACYVTGGWEPRGPGCRCCGTRPWTWIC
jgi:hypothetical protein